jgi:hypothetical protein
MTHRFAAFRLTLASLAVAALVTMHPLAAQSPSSAQPAAPAKAAAAESRMLQLTVAHIRPGMMREYIDYQKSDVIPALEKAGIKSRRSWRTAVFGNLFEVAHVTDISSLDQYDSPPPMQSALGEQGFAAYQAKLGGMVTDARTYAIRTRPDLSYFADESYRPKMAILTTVEVMPDKNMAFETFIKNDWIPALKQGGGTYYAVSQVMYGGSATTYMTLVGIDTFADLAKGHPVLRALGEQGMNKMMTRAAGFSHHIERSVIKLDPDLSFDVTATSEAK